jgi:hypothetical protein
MLGLKEAKMVLAQLGLSEEQTNQFEVLITPHIEFHKYLMEKLDISSEEAEKMTETFSKNYITDEIEKFAKNGGNIADISEDEYFRYAGASMKTIALDNGYDTTSSDLLETNMIKLTKMFLSVVKK